MAICIAIIVSLTSSRSQTGIPAPNRVGSFSNDDFSMEWL